MTGWLDRVNSKKENRKLGDADEKRAAKNLRMKRSSSSGAAGKIRSDLFDAISVGECKTTGAKQITIKRAWLTRLETISARAGKTPFMTISFDGGDDHYVIMTRRDFNAIVDAANGAS